MGTEVEMDMRVFSRSASLVKPSLPELLSRIAATCPLLGNTVISVNNFKVIEETALRAIKLALEYRELNNFAHLAIFIAILQYAKNWERTESSGFWAFICEQLGYKYSQPLYAILTNSVQCACKQYNRVFIKESNGDNSYYSTVLAHAIAPRKSFYALCDFLIRFYKNNLDCSVYPDDPAIDRMAEVLRHRCKGTALEPDEEIRGNVSGIQVGFRALLAQRPAYMREFLARVLQRIDTLLSGDDLGDKDYTDTLLTQWYADKFTEPTVKRGASTHKRTTDIALSYGKIRLGFILDDDGEPAIRIPSIRLASHENPVVIIFSGEMDVYRRTIGVYGNDYSSTSEETIIPMSDLSDVDLADWRIELFIGTQRIYSSNRDLWIEALLFKDGMVRTSKTVEEGNYVLFMPKSAIVNFQGNIERQRRSYYTQLYDIYIQGEVSVYVNGILLCCSRPPAGSLRFRLPQSQAEFIKDGTSYPIYARNTITLSAVGKLNSTKLIATTQDEFLLPISKGVENVYQIGLPVKNGCYTISLSDGETGRIFDEVRLCIVDNITINFDEPYYLENSERGILSLSVDGESSEVPLSGCGAKAKAVVMDGEIHVQIPRIRLLLDGQPLLKNAVWKGQISPSSHLRVICPDSLNVSMSVGGFSLSKLDALGGVEYAIGNAVQAYDGDDVKLSAELYIAENKHHMFDIVLRPCLLAIPSFKLSGNTLTWLNPNSFVGDDEVNLEFSFRSKNGTPIIIHYFQGKHILCNNFPEKSERYEYKITAITETTFGMCRTQVDEGSVIFGNRYEIIFRGETLLIAQVIEDGSHTEIKPFFIDDIRFVGKENLGYTDLCGEYAHYTGMMYFITRNGKRYFADLNPVDIYLVNETAGRLHISFDSGAGLFIDKSGDYLPELYKHTDPPPKLARFFTIPDYFEFMISKEMYKC